MNIKIVKYPIILVIVLFNIYTIAQNPNNIDLTINHYKKHIEKLDKNSTLYFSSINHLGDLYRIKGNSPKTLNILLKNEQEIKSKLGSNNLVLAQCYDIIGEIYYYASDIDEAFKYWNKSLTIKLKLFGENNVYTAESYCLIGRYYNYKIDKQKAYDYTLKALEIVRRHKTELNKIDVSKIYREYAYSYKILLKDSDYKKAFKNARIYYDTAIYYSNKQYGKGNYYSSKIYHDIGNLYTDEAFEASGIYRKKEINNIVAKAKSYYHKSLDIKYKYFGSNHEEIGLTYYVIGLLYEYAYGSDSIKTVITNYHNAIQSLIPNYNNPDIYSLPPVDLAIFNKALLLEVLDYKTMAIEKLYYKTKNIEYLKSAFNHSEIAVKYWELILHTYKSHELYNALGIYNHLPFNHGVKIAYSLYELTNDEAYLSKVFEYSEKSKYSVLLKGLIYTRASDLNKFKINTVNINSVQRQLDNNTAFVEYFINDGIYIMVIDKTQFKCIKLSDEEIDKQIFCLRDAIEKFDFTAYTKNAELLYNRLIQPVEDIISPKINKLIIAPCGNLSLIPFDALITDSTIPPNKDYRKLKYLINKYQISYALSSSILNYQNKPETYNNQVLAFSPNFKTKSELPFTRQMLNKLSEKVKGKFFFDDEATKANFLNNKDNYSIIHFGTHSIANIDNSIPSKIYFSEADTNNYLSLDELSEININSDLVILSACETGYGKFEKGEGIISYARGFSLSGAKSTIITLWKVDDQTTNEIINKFYVYLISGAPKAEALHKAKLDYLNISKTSDNSNPFYWSGIVLTGTDNVIPLKIIDNNMVYFLIGAGIMLLTIILFFLYRKKKSV